MAAAAPADGNPEMPCRLFLVPGQQGSSGSGRSRHASRAAAARATVWWTDYVAAAERAVAAEEGTGNRPADHLARRAGAVPRHHRGVWPPLAAKHGPTVCLRRWRYLAAGCGGGARAFFLTFSITRRDAPPDPTGATSPVWWSLVSKAPVDVAAIGAAVVTRSRQTRRSIRGRRVRPG